MSDDRLRMTDLLNGDRFSNDNRFDMHLCSARKELVGALCAKLIAIMPLTRRVTAGGLLQAAVADSTSSLFGDLDWGAKRMVLRPVNACKVNFCKINFCKAKGNMFPGPSVEKCVFRSRSRASQSGNPA